MQNKQVSQQQAPSFFKLWACLIYEALVVIAILIVSTFLFLLLLGDAGQGWKRYLLQLWLLISAGLYFVWSWHKTGHTLAMQTWQLQLLNQNNQLLSVPVAIARYLLACLGLLTLGFGFLWVFLDHDRLFLHDRLLGSKLIYVPRNKAL